MFFLSVFWRLLNVMKRWNSHWSMQQHNFHFIRLFDLVYLCLNLWMQMENMVFFFAELAMLHYSMIKYCPSMLAASAVYAARCTLKKSPVWSETLKSHTGFFEPELQYVFCCCFAFKSIICSHVWLTELVILTGNAQRCWWIFIHCQQRANWRWCITSTHPLNVVQLHWSFQSQRCLRDWNFQIDDAGVVAKIFIQLHFYCLSIISCLMILVLVT